MVEEVAAIISDHEAFEEDKDEELPMIDNQDLHQTYRKDESAAKVTPLGIYSNLGERRRKIKQPQHFDF